MNYGSLNLKSDYSLLKSMIKLNDLISFACDNKINVLSLIDDNLCGSLEFYNLCTKNNIKPIIGLEVNYEEEKICLIAKNYDGYRNLLKISRYGSSIDVLKKYSSNLILIGFNNLNIFDDFYNINEMYFKEIKCLKEEDEPGLKYLKAIDLNKKVIEIENINNCSFEIIDDKSTLEIINKCNLNLDVKANILRYSEEDSYILLKKTVTEGARKKFGNSIQKVYLDRLKYELDVIEKTGFCDYFLIVYDYVKFAKENNIMVGPGRGSAAGSLVSYLLDITEVDPIKYGLLFERFLNIERVSMPDIDIDFEFDRREEVIKYCASKYGMDRVANIIAFGTLKSRAVIRDLARVMEIDDSVYGPLSKALDPFLSLKDNYENVKKYLYSYELKRLYKLGLLLEGLKRNVTMHAAGIVMSDSSLSDYVPMILNGNDYIAGFIPEYLEQIGLLKMDFLGLKNLSILRDSIEKVKLINPDFDIYKIPLNDKETLDLFRKGNTLGIFQFESNGMIEFLKRLDVNSFDDIVAANALFRPGPANNIDLFIERKKGKASIDYYHESLEPILKSTYGVMIYQEQIMLVASTMAGFSLGEADILRRAMSKKKSSVMESEKEKFINGSIKNGYSKEVSEIVFKAISKFAEYGFNKAHSVAYALLAYRMAYIKIHYKECFYVSLLSYFNGDSKIKDYLYEARLNGVTICKPNINISSNLYEVTDMCVYLPFSSIKGVGSSIVNLIVEDRKKGKYLSIFDFVKRVKVNKNVLTALILSGCFDSFEYNRRTLYENIDVIENYSDLGDVVSDDFFELIKYEEFSKKELLILERDYLGINFNSELINEYSVKVPNSVNIKDIDKYFDKDINVVLMVSKIKKIKTKDGSYMAFVSGTDNVSKIEIIVFSNVLEKLENISINDIVLINGHVERRYSEYQLIAKDINKLD